MLQNRKTRVGRVISDKMQKTVVVAVATTHKHRIYKKLIRHHTHMMAHDEHGMAKIGDLVRIVETRPLSKLKHWVVLEVLESRERGAPVSEVAGVEA
ncbi:MAG TPA: 30S ribosomal protein S17 [Chloroflexota bacterium]|nr:30S ribosomal protein S17 [Chloroflexota bacterium]